MKKTALYKDIFRNIGNSRGRFISIVLIIALGVAFFSGLKITPETMKCTADQYYKDYNLMDIRVVSELGLVEDDINIIKKIRNVDQIEGAKFIDVLAREGESDSVFRVHGYRDKNQINGYRLIEGRLPKKANECIIEKGVEEDLRFPIGSKVKLESGREENLSQDLKNTEYKVVGAVQNPYYLSFEKGNSDIGNGRITGFISIPEENFKSDIFTDIYIRVKDANEENSYGKNYFKKIDPIVENLENLAPKREKERYKKIIGEAKEELKEAEDKYREKKEDLDRNFLESKDELEKSKLEIDSAEKKLKLEKEEFEKELKLGEKNIRDAREELDKGKLKYEVEKEDFDLKKKELENKLNNIEESIKDGKEELKGIENKNLSLYKELENSSLSEEKIEQIEIEIETNKLLIDTISKKISEAKMGKKQIEDNLELGQVELDKAKENLVEIEEKIVIEDNNLKEGKILGEVELDKGEERLSQAKKELDYGIEAYEKARKEADKKLNEAKKDLNEARREIKNIEEGRWHILDRNKHYSYLDYEGAADRIDALSKVFPVFFALVAGLVCLTSMARMVDEQRGNIGTLKALGYSNLDIGLKYIIYALIASIVGCIIGFAIGYTVFPFIIFNAYALMYLLPPIKLNFNLGLTLAISLVAIMLTTITAYLASSNSLKENAASLMRPKAPKQGKRILLEKIDIIWKRFNFSQKVTLRNIFRYKRRFFMTLFGVAGCTALILAGFGIKDSIRTVADRQYGEIFKYDLSIDLEEEVNIDRMNLDCELDSYTLIHKENGSIEKLNHSRELSIIVADDIEEIENFISLQDRRSLGKINFPKEGIVISEQVAKNLDISAGDYIYLKNKDGSREKVLVSDVTENYTFNYAYMSANYYENIFKEESVNTNILANLKNKDKKHEEDLAKKLLENKEIRSLNFNSIVKEDFNEIISSLNYVVLVMIVSAGALAFVVLYNLTNINISERVREIATIKVLGFYDKEVSAYIYRENIIISVLGSILGLFMGIYLHKFIMVTVEMDNIMFGLSLNKLSYIYSIILTLGFSIIVNIVMHYKLKEIKMVESLKSIE